MANNFKWPFLLPFLCSVLLVQEVKSQSPDTRICNCVPGGGIAADFMLTTRAEFGRFNITLTRNGEIQPEQLQPVKFTIPVLTPKTGCHAMYSIVVYDSDGNKEYENSLRSNVINYAFKDCNKTYEVTLGAFVKTAAGGEGNCTRNIRFTVKPRCNTAVCECADDRPVNPGYGADLNISGTFKCIAPTPSNRVYLFKFDIVNKTDCILKVESIAVLGSTKAVPDHSILARATKRAVSVGYTTPLTTPAPTGTKVTIRIKYTLNGRPCTTSMDVPYQACTQ